MSDERDETAYGPGTRWVARQSGRTPEDLTASPAAAVAAVGEAVHQVAELATRLGSDDPEVRAAAQEEADELRRQLETEPTPGQRFGSRVAQVLRDAAERLDHPPR
jgi:hypothetical protein